MEDNFRTSVDLLHNQKDRLYSSLIVLQCKLATLCLVWQQIIDSVSNFLVLGSSDLFSSSGSSGNVLLFFFFLSNVSLPPPSSTSPLVTINLFSMSVSLFLVFFVFVFVFDFWLHWVLVAAGGTFVEACRIFHCSARALLCGAWASL